MPCAGSCTCKQAAALTHLMCMLGYQVDLKSLLRAAYA